MGTRGGRGRPGTARIAGVDIAYDDGIFISDRPQPSPFFPTRQIELPEPLSKDERIQVARYRALRERIHGGPLYTVLGNSGRISKPGDRANTAAAHFDPFEGMQKMSDVYTKKRRKMPKLDTRPYVLKFFPRELWLTLDPSEPSAPGDDDKTKPKKLLTTMPRKSNGLSAFDREISGDDPNRAIIDGEEEDEATEQVDEDVPEEELDNEYASDEDEMAGDYNAEQYFDDGGDDAGDDYDAGEADGGEF